MSDERFKNRKEALKWLEQRGKISQGKFYQDCERGHIEHDGRRIVLTIYPDKSVSKYQIMEYAEAVFGFTRQNQSAIDLSDKKEKLEVRERELKIAKLERENRKDDCDWIARETVHEREGALVGTIFNEIVYRIEKSAPAVISVCKGDPAREREIKHLLKQTVYEAFRTIYENPEIDMTFEGDDE